MIATKFANHKNAQAIYLTDGINDMEYLQSYDTIVISSWHDYEHRRIHHTISGLYSATTRKHISWYADLQGLRYKDFKWAYEHNCNIIKDLDSDETMFENRETGEIIKTIKH